VNGGRAGPIQPTPGGIRLRIWVQPRARSSEIVGIQGDAIRVRLAAPPVDGRANEVLVGFLAERLQVSRAAVTLLAGQTARLKAVGAAGLDQSTAVQRLGL
jgi:uncharacterized protein (TIGR00251 family)